MPVGRKPIPTHLKIVNGNPGKRPLNKNEPRFTPEIPDCPPHLDAVAREEWERLTPELSRLNLLTTVDRAALAAYCQAWSLWVEATQKVRVTGLVVMVNQTYDEEQKKMVGGMPAKNPYLAIAEKASAEMRAYLTEFGFTPASRTRIAIPSKKAHNAFSAL